MFLYTINGLYPDKNFNFTLTTENMGLSPVEHEHVEDNVISLVNTLNGKADIDHSHNYVVGLCGDEVNAPTAFTITVSTAIGATNQATIALTNNTLTINYVSPSTGNVYGFKESNPNNGKVIVQFYSGNDAVVTDDASINLTLQENVYD